jgi:hypothetical protein
LQKKRIKSPLRYLGSKSCAVETIAKLISDFAQRKCLVRDNILVENGISARMRAVGTQQRTAKGFLTARATSNETNIFYQYYVPNGTKKLQNEFK